MKLLTTLIVAALLILLGAWLFRKGCSKAQGPSAVAKTDTLWLHDTVTKTAYVPKPYAVTKIKEVAKSTTTPAENVHCADLVLYRDTVVFKYGSVVLNDEVQGNRIISRQPTWNISVPVITKPAKKRTAVFVGLNAAAIQYDGAIAFGPSIALKTKRDKVYEVGGMLDSRGKWVVGAGVKFKISFRKS